MIQLKKMARLVGAYTQSKKKPLPIWTHLWVTEKCNLDCDYCYVSDNDSEDPSTEDLMERIDHAADLGSAVIAFMGGEPTLRHDISSLIVHAGKRNMLTYLTTNAQHRIFHRVMVNMAKAGLDFLEVSVDAFDYNELTDKTLGGTGVLVARLKSMIRGYGTRFKLHQVLSPQNLEETSELLEVAEDMEAPISFGLVSTPLAMKSPYEGCERKLEEVLDLIKEKKERGVHVLNPFQYFDAAKKFLNGGVSWPCDVGKFSIQVSTEGYVYRCSVMRSVSATRFLDIDNSYFAEGMHDEHTLLPVCQKNCFSACAYSMGYYRQHPLEFAKQIGKSAKLIFPVLKGL